MKTANKKLFTRNAVPADAEEIAALSAKVYRKEPYTAPELRGQINNFPEGVFVAVYEDKIVGYCATLRISERSAFRSLRIRRTPSVRSTHMTARLRSSLRSMFTCKVNGEQPYSAAD